MKQSVGNNLVTAYLSCLKIKRNPLGEIDLLFEYVWFYKTNFCEF